jgi:hypothetical protein
MARENSRYAATGILTRTLPDGREAAYYARRFIPDAASFEMAGTIRVEPGARSDLIAARAYGDPTASWRIADGNRSMDLVSLAEVTGRILDIPVAKPDGEAS